jgi:hypothetical protein
MQVMKAKLKQKHYNGKNWTAKFQKKKPAEAKLQIVFFGLQMRNW